MEDYNAQSDAASPAELKQLDALLYDYLCGRLGGLTARQLLARLERCVVWRKYKSIKVYKTVDRPCVAYVAVQQGSEAILLVLGFCLGIPPDDDGWWAQTIHPRLKELI